MAQRGRPKTTGKTEAMAVVITEEKDTILLRLKIDEQYQQSVVIMDVSDIVPYSAKSNLDEIFAKMGLIIKRQFGYVGFSWGYGPLTRIIRDNAYPEESSNLSLCIYFQRPLEGSFLVDNAKRFDKILGYIKREWDIHQGMAAEFE